LENEILQVPRPRALVVDDNVDAADTLASLLGFFDWKVNVAYSGAEALVLGDVIRPQLVILDIVMPGLDGCETASRMRLRPWGQEATIIALTAWVDEMARDCTQQAGMNFLLTKPVAADLLLDILSTLRA
jgi:CheY-like chemotaxis protein